MGLTGGRAVQAQHEDGYGARAVIKSPEARERLAAQGYVPESGSPQQLADMIKSEIVRYGKLVKAVGMQAE